MDTKTPLIFQILSIFLLNSVIHLLLSSQFVKKTAIFLMQKQYLN